MVCNVCGGQIPIGESVCKYCGNVVKTEKKIERTDDTREIKMPPKAQLKSDYTQERVTIYRDNRNNGRYCTKCGRPLDGVTNKCIVCDAREVSKRAYINEEYKSREMNTMAQKRKKKKNTNTALLVTLAVLGTILLFMIAIIFAAKIADKWGIGSSGDDDTTSSITMTHKPKRTPDPNWEAETDSKDNEEEDEEEEETPKPTEHTVRTPVPQSTADPVDERGGEYLYNTHTTLISEEELEELERQKIKYIYWEIYARHGYTFDGELADYFENNHSWYMPTTSDTAKVEAQFNDIEKRNIRTIEAYQREQGWR